MDMKKYAKPIALVAILVVAIALIFVSVYFNSLEKDKEFTLGDFTVVSEGSGISIVSSILYLRQFVYRLFDYDTIIQSFFHSSFNFTPF